MQTGQLAHNYRIAILRVLQNGSNLSFAPGDLARDFLFNKLNLTQVSIVGQFQNIRFVLFQILVQFGNP